MDKLTIQQSLMEYIRCVNDPVYAIENYLETHDVTSHKYVPFKLFEKQKELVWSYENFQETIATKSRQQGVTTTTAAYFAVKMILAPKSNPEHMVIITNKLDSSMKILAQVVKFLEQLSEHPFFFIDQENLNNRIETPKKVFSINSKKECFLSHNGSSVKAISSGKDSSRTLTSSFLLFDEAAFIEKGMEIYMAALPLIATGGKCAMISTANGRDELYFALYQGVINKTNNFNLVEMRWYMDPRFNKDLQWLKGEVGTSGYEVIDEKDFTIESYKKMVDTGYKATSTWYRGMCAKQNGNKRAIAQEIDVDFLNSGGDVISAEAQKVQREENQMEPFMQDPDVKDMWIWKTPEEVQGHRIIMSVDPSSGSGDDFASIQLLDVDYVDEDGTPGVDQIGEYYGKFKPNTLGELAYHYAVLYNAFVIIDCIGGWGFPIAELFMQNKYKDLYYDSLSNMTSLLKSNKRFENIRAGNGKPAGFHNGALRPIIGNKLENYIENNILKMRSVRAIGELGNWIWKGDRRDHTRSGHDDALMALGLGIFVFENSFGKLKASKAEMDANLAVFSATTYVPPVNKTVGTQSSVRPNRIGQVEEKKTTINNSPFIRINYGGSYGSSDPRAAQSDYQWLLR